MFNILDGFEFEHEIRVVIEGEAPGADTLAKEWARSQQLLVEPYPADWASFGRAAGPIRNQQMIDEGRPTHAFAFYDVPRIQSRGTADMVRRLKKAGVTLEEVDPQWTSNH